MSMPIQYTTRDQWISYINNISGDKINLKLSGLGLTDNNIIGLADALRTDTRVNKLNLANNKISSGVIKSCTQENFDMS